MYVYEYYPVKIFHVRRRPGRLLSPPILLSVLACPLQSGNQQGSFLCSFAFWFLAGCKGLQNLVELDVVLSWLLLLPKGWLLLPRLRDSWVCEGSGFRVAGSTAVVVRTEGGFRLVCYLWWISLLEISESCMPRAHGVLPKQGVREALSSRNRRSCLVMWPVLRRL